jgi:HPt (histidine-containing phosphotransfer) domain-containing protein
MDFERFCEDLEMDRETGLEMLQLFYDTSISDMARIESGVIRGSTEDVADGAHSIKGAARNLGIEKIQQIATDLEARSRNNVLDGAEVSLAVLRGEIESLGVRLRTGSLEDLDI